MVYWTKGEEIAVTKERLLEILRESGIGEHFEDLDDGPTAVCIADHGKSTVLQLEKSGETLIVTEGKIFKRRRSIPLSEL